MSSSTNHRHAQTHPRTSQPTSLVLWLQYGEEAVKEGMGGGGGGGPADIFDLFGMGGMGGRRGQPRERRSEDVVHRWGPVGLWEGSRVGSGWMPGFVWVGP